MHTSGYFHTDPARAFIFDLILIKAEGGDG
jgi:hypothetical protein